MNRANLLLLLLALAVPAGAAAPPSEPQDVIRQIYAAHQPWADKSIDFDELSGLTKYFDASLVELVRKDQEYSAKEHDMGCLDFDPLLDAQDYDEAGITTPQIREVRQSKGVLYEVTFTGKSEAWKNWNVKLLYDVRKTDAGWRVHDITYKSGHSLRSILKCSEK